MKIGTITFFRKNYGAVLQAYALQSVFNTLGQSAEILDHGADAHANTLFDPWMNAKGGVLNLFKILRYKSFRDRVKRFNDFERKYLKVSERVYADTCDLENSHCDYDAFISGSDQVWRPGNEYDRIRFYFLGFVERDKAIKVTYAPSFGVSTVSAAYGAQIEPLIQDIPNLSVREETGRDIIEQVTGRQATLVLDPTLLLESPKWNDIANPNGIERPYILVYSTSQRGLFSELVKHIKNATGLPVVVLSLYSLNLIPMADHVIYDAGPSEFIGLFANAACVCTNSFHGTAFSIIYRKPFWSVPHNATNSRMADLLRRIKLSDRQPCTPDQFPASPLEIDYSEPADLLDRAKSESIQFLDRALQT